MINLHTIYIEGSYNTELNNDTLKLSSLADKFVVIEEKIDGIDIGLSFDNNANISIQTKSKIANVEQFSQLHTWANENTNKLWELIYDRYILFGQWVYEKRSIFYNNLCAYLIETNIYDRKEDKFLSTYRRQDLISKTCGDLICSVPIIKIGRINTNENIKSYIMPSFYKTDEWKYNLKLCCDKYGYDFFNVMRETDDSTLMVGVNVKYESKDYILGQYTYMRKLFLDTGCRFGAIINNILAGKWMFLSYELKKYLGYDSDTKLYKWEYKIVDSEFEEI